MGFILVKAVVPHWSKYFDTLEDMQDANQLIRVEPVRPKTQLHTSQLEYMPWSGFTTNWEKRETAPSNISQSGLGSAESLIPGIAHGEVYDEDILREGGAFVYPKSLPYLGDLPVTRRPDNIDNVLIGSTQKPDYYAGVLEGRMTPEGTIRGGFDPDQVFLISDPKLPFQRKDLGYVHSMGRGYRSKTPSEFLESMAPEYRNEPTGRAAQALIAAGVENPSLTYDWGDYPKTVDREFITSRKVPQFTEGMPDKYLEALETGWLGGLPIENVNPRKVAGEPMDIAFLLLKAPRIPRKKGQPANSKKHSDLYTDENPKGTIQGLGFKNPAKAKQSVVKIKNSNRSHAHKTQAAIAMEQRAREMGKIKEAGIYRNFIESQKVKTKQKSGVKS